MRGLVGRIGSRSLNTGVVWINLNGTSLSPRCTGDYTELNLANYPSLTRADFGFRRDREHCSLTFRLSPTPRALRDYIPWLVLPAFVRAAAVLPDALTCNTIIRACSDNPTCHALNDIDMNAIRAGASGRTNGVDHSQSIGRDMPCATRTCLFSFIHRQCDGKHMTRVVVRGVAAPAFTHLLFILHTAHNISPPLHACISPYAHLYAPAWFNTTPHVT